MIPQVVPDDIPQTRPAFQRVVLWHDFERPGTQSQFSENVCLEDDLRSRIFGTFVVKFLACLPACLRVFEHLKNCIIAHF